MQQYTNLNDSKCSQKRREGFTLLELIVAIAVSTILVALAVPSFKSQIEQSRFTSAANEIVTALNYARGEALRRSRPVSVRMSGTSWEDGWVAFVDPARSGILGAQTPLRQGNTLGSVTISGSPAFVLFDSNGRRRSDVSDPFISFDIFKAGGDPTTKRTVCVAQSGRIFSVKGVATCV